MLELASWDSKRLTCSQVAGSCPFEERMERKVKSGMRQALCPFEERMERQAG